MSLAVDLETAVRDGRSSGDEGERFSVAADFTVAAGETLVVLGPSGSGKTLLLEAIAGVRPCEGGVELAGRDLRGVPPEDRGFGFVFQDRALFPHLTVRENVAYGIRYHDDARDPDAVLAALGIADLADRSPRTLSGGEAQRVALARSLAIDPEAFLLDEPLAALDAPTRASLRADLAERLADETAIYVTHDRTTARALADRIAVVGDGDIHQLGSPESVFERPDSTFVAEFTGANWLSRDGLPQSLRESLPAGDSVAIRPEHVVLDGPEPDATGTVHRTVREDAAYRVTVDVGGERLDALTTEPPAGETVGVALPRAHCHAIGGD